jgi:hypothetical protein
VHVLWHKYITYQCESVFISHLSQNLHCQIPRPGRREEGSKLVSPAIAMQLFKQRVSRRMRREKREELRYL